MRKPLILALFVAVLTPGIAQAAERVVLNREKIARANTPVETWDNGSFGRVNIRTGWGYDVVDINWSGTVYDDSGNVVFEGSYDFQASTTRGEGTWGAHDPEVSVFRSRKLDTAKYWLWDEGDILNDGLFHTIAFEISWIGVGDALREKTVDGEITTVEAGRAATPTGTIKIDGVVVPGGDLSLATQV
jgi:hypothetical protein